MTEADLPELARTTFGSFLEALGARTPVPAGGAAAGLSAAFGAALLAMVSRYTTGARYADVEGEMRALADELVQLERECLETVAADTEAFGAVAAAYELPKTTDEERAERAAAIRHGLRGALEPPLELAARCMRLALIARRLATRGHQPILSDVGSAAACLAAAADGTLVNLAANGTAVEDGAARERLDQTRRSLGAARDDLRALVDEVQARYGSP